MKVSIILAVFNEEKTISRRLQNILDTKSNSLLDDGVEIILASDGSTDNTVNVAGRFKDCMNLRIFSFERRGKALTHNQAVSFAKGEILVFTDADTEFDKTFVKNIVKYFSLKKTGCVTGNLIYKSKESAISKSEGLYWEFEKKWRNLESKLGILATASGACMAVRKNLWRDLNPIDDCDFTTPLDIILQGYKVVYAPNAIAYDVPPSSITAELKARIRQTSKNLMGTLRRWGWRGWLRHPFVSWGLLSHKIFRWFTPFFLIGAFISNLLLLDDWLVYRITFVGQIAFYIIAIVGLGGKFLKRRVPIASTIFSFCVANLGMGIGVIKGIIGKAPTTYKMKE